MSSRPRAPGEPYHWQSDWSRMGFGNRGVSYAVSPSIMSAMSSNVPISAPIVVDALSSLEGPVESPRSAGSGAQTLDRDARGRLIAASPIVEAADEKLPAEEVRVRLRALYGQLPRGSLAGLARACGYRSAPRQSLRQVARGRGKLVEASRRRISRVLQQIECGELVCVEVPGKRVASYPKYVWEQRGKPRAAPDSINMRKNTSV